MFVDKLQVTPYDPATQYFEHMIFKTIFPEVFSSVFRYHSVHATRRAIKIETSAGFRRSTAHAHTNCYVIIEENGLFLHSRRVV